MFRKIVKPIHSSYFGGEDDGYVLPEDFDDDGFWRDLVRDKPSHAARSNKTMGRRRES